MFTLAPVGNVQNFSATDARHRQLKQKVDDAGARLRAAGPALDAARDALLEAVAASAEAQKKNGNISAYYAGLLREQNLRQPEQLTKDVPTCTEELDAVVATAFATFVAARKEFDDASFESREANSAFGQHLGQTGR